METRKKKTTLPKGIQVTVPTNLTIVEEAETNNVEVLPQPINNEAVDDSKRLKIVHYHTTFNNLPYTWIHLHRRFRKVDFEVESIPYVIFRLVNIYCETAKTEKNNLLTCLEDCVEKVSEICKPNQS